MSTMSNKTRCLSVRGYRLFVLLSVGWLLLLPAVLSSGCAASRAGLTLIPGQQADYRRLRERLAQRADSTRSASYRVRWQVREIQPHSDLILRIDYRAPDRFHIVGKGPMDIPVFTAWAADSQFVLLAHREDRYFRGHLDDLALEDFMVDARSFSGFLELFSGGCGVVLPDTLDPFYSSWDKITTRELVFRDRQGRSFTLDWRNARPKKIEWEYRDSLSAWDLNITFGKYSDTYPFWQLKSASWENRNGPGMYRWEILQQKYNPDLPDRLFDPPGGW